MPAICEQTKTQVFLRRPTFGPELAMVRAYIEEGLPAPADHERLAIFIEPRIESGYPDVVAAYWNPLVLHKRQGRLSKNDLRIVHWLYCAEEASIDEFCHHFGKQFRNNLQNLESAELIYCDVGKYRLNAVDQIFSISRLIAIEAKISSWCEGLNQAVQNTWFASESYLLLDHAPSCQQNLQAEAEILGVGVLFPDIPVEYAEPAARVDRIPHSYGSWMFNEWLLEYAFEH